MKLLVFAHTPPPHHGQSYMVQLMLEGLRGKADLQIYHVNSRLSKSTAEIGSFQAGKVLRLAGYCAQALWQRLRYDARFLYYVPAPGKRAALYRDWLVMFCCRPFFRHLILHWHAVGLGEWLETEARGWERRLTRWLLGGADLALVVAAVNGPDAMKLFPKRLEVLHNGLPDPCPDFDMSLLPQRRQRAEERARRRVGQPSRGEMTQDAPVFRVLFLALCSREKGLFDAMAAVRRAADEQSPSSPLRWHLTVAGAFASPGEQAEFERLQNTDGNGGVRITYFGFADAEAKDRLLREHDCLCFPTFYPNEGLPLNLVEAAAYGLPAVTARWRGVPEALPPDYPYLIEPHAISQIADALLRCAQATADDGACVRLREHYLENLQLKEHLRKLRHALMALPDSVPSSS